MWAYTIEDVLERHTRHLFIQDPIISLNRAVYENYPSKWSHLLKPSCFKGVIVAINTLEVLTARPELFESDTINSNTVWTS